ncbi:histone-lysine N-methyltransferase SETMAR [Plakobranchus ocellatus]|uniref:Histone-lysine N-methyltransferase SETMAR n=1 Tax=Plakobranchus ocellatus TaxID=259542 RepID=A0AAV3YYU3_9GAST|nr:histone-lysine N-methyltransferase SETMAR [Plakobranchus ocellatus]
MSAPYCHNCNGLPKSLCPKGSKTTHCRKDMCTQLLERYNGEEETFLQCILTGDKSWAHYYDPECKAQWMEYRHKTSPSPRKFKVVASARKVLFTVFWDMEGMVNMEFLEQGQTVNSELSRLRRVWHACTPVTKLRTP